jgi:hypothetical protein
VVLICNKKFQGKANIEMARMVALVYALIICVAVVPSYGEYYSKGSHVPRKEKVTRLHFFLHDIVSGKSPSAVVKVAGSNRTQAGDISPAPFSKQRIRR